MATIFQTAQWREIIMDIYGYEISRLDDVTAFIVRRAYIQRKVTNMPFNFYPDISAEEARATICRFTDYCRTAPGTQAEIKLLQPLIADSLVENLGWSVGQPFILSQFDLLSDVEETYAACSKNLIKNIRRIRNKIAKEGICIEQAESSVDVDMFFDLLLKVYRDRHQMPCHPPKLYRKLFQTDVAKYYLARCERQVVGGVVIIPDDSVWHYCWGATQPEFLQQGVSMALIDKAICGAITAGARTFDFGTSSPYDSELLEFKRRWGCKFSPAYHYYYPAASKLAAVDYHESYQLIRKVYKHIPTSLLKRMLPFVVPHFG